MEGPQRLDNATQLTYAVGDIHGCLNQLIHLSQRIIKHAAGRNIQIIFLGDYIDRGRYSAEVIQFLKRLQQRFPRSVTCLKGNHEEMMVSAYERTMSTLVWKRNGGGATLRSFGVESPRELPLELISWARCLPYVAEDARRYYVHAGFEPGNHLSIMDPKVCLWARKEFLSVDYDFGKHVVHGHTPVADYKPDVRAYRTNLDTGCVYGGHLTAGVYTELQDEAVEYIQV